MTSDHWVHNTIQASTAFQGRVGALPILMPKMSESRLDLSKLKNSAMEIGISMVIMVITIRRPFKERKLKEAYSTGIVEG